MHLWFKSLGIFNGLGKYAVKPSHIFFVLANQPSVPTDIGDTIRTYQKF